MRVRPSGDALQLLRYLCDTPWPAGHGATRRAITPHLTEDAPTGPAAGCRLLVGPEERQDVHHVIGRRWTVPQGELTCRRLSGGSAGEAEDGHKRVRPRVDLMAAEVQVQSLVRRVKGIVGRARRHPALTFPAPRGQVADHAPII